MKIEKAQTDIVLNEFYNIDCLVERSRVKANWSMPGSHKHNVYEIYYLLEGHVYYIIDYNIYNVNEGDIVLIPKDTMHRTLRGTEDACERLLVYFSDKYVGTAQALGETDDQHALTSPAVVSIPPKNRERVKQIFTELHAESTDAGEFSSFRIAHLFFELMFLVFRHGDAASFEKSDTVEARIEEAVSYIHENYAQQITLEDLAKIACVERTYFSKVFKRVMGLNFQDYLAQVRLEKAIDYLLTSPLSVGEIALNCGFLSINYFGDFFKKHMGISPNKYRKQSLEK